LAQPNLKHLTEDLTPSNTHISSTIPASTFNSWIKSSGIGSYTTPELVPITASSSSANSSATDSYGNKYGTLYNYAAASAGTYTYAEGAGTGNAQFDLCPYGWRLSTGGNGGEFEDLTIDGYDLATFAQWNTDGFISMESTLGFSRGGRFYDGTPFHQGVYAEIWSSALRDGSFMRPVLR
jgi:hypothetical protein